MMKKGYIQIAGKEYPCRLTMGAMVRFKEQTGIDLPTMKQDEMDFSRLMMLMYCCLVSACRVDAMEHPFDEMIDMADQITPEDMVEWQQANLMAQTDPEDSKKKKVQPE